MLNDSVKPLADQRWLRISQVLVTMPVLAVLGVTVWARLPALGGACSEDVSFFATAVFWLVTPPYILSLLGLVGKSPAGLKKGLAWAIVAGSFWGVVGLGFGLLDVFGGSAGEAWQPLLLGLVQAALVTSAIKTYRSLPQEKGDAGVLVKRAVWFIPYLILIGVCGAALPDLYYTTRESREASVVQALRRINAAQESYARAYPRGFSPTLAALGPPAGGSAPTPAAAGLIAADLAKGEKSHYTFRYTHNPPDAAGAISAYTLTATPTQTACTSWKRFFTDQTGVIRVTSESRPATVSDPAL